MFLLLEEGIIPGFHLKEFDFEVVYMGKLVLANIFKSFYVSVKIVFEKQF